MDMDAIAALLDSAPVGRIYLEEASGDRTQVTYTKPARKREPMVRFRGRVYYQAHRLGDETWVYRTTDTGHGQASDPWLSEAVSVGEAGWVHPVDWPAPPDPEADAYGHVVAAIAALKAFPGQAAVVERLERALLPEPEPVDELMPPFLQPVRK